MEPPVEKDELLAMLDLIEEQARLTIEEFPAQVSKERQRMIIRLAKRLRLAATDPGASLDVAPKATVKLSIS